MSKNKEEDKDKVYVNKNALFIVLLIWICMAGVWIYTAIHTPADVVPKQNITQPTGPQDLTKEQTAKLADDDAILGDPNAPVQIVEFTDYQCPFCGRLANGPIKQIRDTYVKTGKASFVIRDFPLTGIHPYALGAAEAAECAGEQDKYFEMSDVLFANQGNLTSADLKRYASNLDLDMVKFNDCVDFRKMETEVKDDFDTMRTFPGVDGVPVVYINGRVVYGAQVYEAYQKLIEEELKK